MSILRPDEIPAIYMTYAAHIVGDVQVVFQEQLETFTQFLQNIPRELEHFEYAEGKWTVKEVIGHILDTERIMAYRALRFARNDTKALAGFEEDAYVAQARSNERSMESLIDEFHAVRKSNIIMFAHFNSQERQRKGIASERLVSVNGLQYIIAGHLEHHRVILQERYLKD
jgi:uncharacterized damage-inducible protein DinB